MRRPTEKPTQHSTPADQRSRQAQARGDARCTSIKQALIVALEEGAPDHCDRAAALRVLVWFAFRPAVEPAEGKSRRVEKEERLQGLNLMHGVLRFLCPPHNQPSPSPQAEGLCALSYFFPVDIARPPVRGC
jgi:hypothetical protein